MKTNENKSAAYLKLADLLEYFRMDQQITVMENNNMIYQGTVNDIPYRILNLAVISTDQSIRVEGASLVVAIDYDPACMDEE